MTHREKRIDIITKANIASMEYKKNLVGNSFIYIFNNQYIEVLFKIDSFLHLTGINTKMSAKEFYKECIKGTIRQNQIYFSHDHPYDLCVKKVSKLKNLVDISNSELFILKDIKTKTCEYKFGFTEMNFTLCLGEDLNKEGQKKSDKYIAKSFRVGDCFKKTSNVYDVNFILSKSNSAQFYDSLNYTDGSHLSGLPEIILAKIDKNLYNNIIDLEIATAIDQQAKG